MIELFCRCDTPRPVPESGAGKAYVCEKCRHVTHLITAEKLADGNGAGDFDAALTVIAGPNGLGHRLQLGGVLDIELGKNADRHICLAGGPKVSRCHATLRRVDFGPSRWKIVDNKSTNGLFVNGNRVGEYELKPGDTIQIGEYELQYGHVAAIAAGPAPELCPSCEQPLKKKAKICVDCGIQVPSGRPVLTRQGVDENSLYAGAESWIWWISLLVWITPFPIPIRSEAFGTRRPYAIWTIALATILASITFFVAQKSDDTVRRGEISQNGIDLMLWSPHPPTAAELVPASKVHEIATKLDAEDRADLRAAFAKPKEKVDDDELVRRAIVAELAERKAATGTFHPYQLITHAFLHDTSSVYNFAMHLGGNLVFLLCFGTRVNALLGNLATALLYPVLAVCAALVHLTMGGPSAGPMLGASGAIMGLAGMYLILFPVHNVYCAMWISIWLRFKRIYGLKIFNLRGFWVLLIYFGYDIAMNAIQNHFGFHGGVAHWAHIGGFTTGMTLGLVVLLSRQFETHGGDVLSVMLGRRAWPILGKPGRKRRQTPQALTMPSPAYA